MAWCSVNYKCIDAKLQDTTPTLFPLCILNHVPPQVAQARNNIRNTRICMGKKPIVSVTFENEQYNP